MKRWVKMTLIGLILLSVLVHLYPLNNYAIWGSDTGEYYALSEAAAEDGRPWPASDRGEYEGWGHAYPFFPSTYLMASGFSSVADVPLLDCLLLLIPALAALSTIAVFLISRRVIGLDTPALAAAAFVTLAMPRTYATSHPMMGALADPIYLFAIFFFLKSYDDRRNLLPAAILTAALIPTHHLSFYFLVISFLGIAAAMRVIYSDRYLSPPPERTPPKEFMAAIKDLKDSVNRETIVDMTRDARRKEGFFRREIEWWDAVFISCAVLANMLYWTLAAEPFFNNVVSATVGLSVVLLVLGPVISVLLFLLIVGRFRYRPKIAFFDRKALFGVQFLIFIGALAVLSYIVVVGVPGTSIDIGPVIIPLFMPFVAVITFMTPGTMAARRYRDGMAIFFWALMITGSLLLASATKSTVLIPYRHTQYLIVPLGIFCGLGLWVVYSNIWNDKRGLFTIFIVILIAMTSISTYPSQEVMSGFEEGTSEDDMKAVIWSRDHIDGTVATDHRLSSMLFGFGGINATWDYAYNTIHGENITEFQDELEEVQTPSGKRPIDFVLITGTMEKGVALLQWESAEPMSKEAIDKFDEPPFIQLYDDGSTRIYAVAEG